MTSLVTFRVRIFIFQQNERKHFKNVNYLHLQTPLYYIGRFEYYTTIYYKSIIFYKFCYNVLLKNKLFYRPKSTQLIEKVLRENYVSDSVICLFTFVCTTFPKKKALRHWTLLSVNLLHLNRVAI